MSIEENQEIFNKLKYALPLFQAVMNYEIGTVLTDREKVLFYLPSKELDLKVEVNTKLREGTGLYKVIVEKVPHYVARLKHDPTGFDFITKVNPICNRQGEIIGAMSIFQSVQRQEALLGIANNLLHDISNLASTTEEISAQSQQVASIVRGLREVIEVSQTRVNETSHILKFIRDISGQSNLLGINASIEAARAGDHGRGFGVVAQEIRNLANSSNTSITKINEIVRAIQIDSKSIHSQVGEIEEAITQVSDAITYMAGATQQISQKSQELDKTANLL